MLYNNHDLAFLHLMTTTTGKKTFDDFFYNYLYAIIIYITHKESKTT